MSAAPDRELDLPEYAALKDLHLKTELVRANRPTATIVAPADGAHDEEAGRIQRAIERHTSVRLPVVTDTSPAGAVPFAGHLIALGNRCTNRTIGALYDLYYTLLDLRYPGPGGHVLRSLHNPFGDGRNAILVGGSDAAGIGVATDALIKKLAQVEIDQGTLALDWLMDIELDRHTRLPEKLEDFEIWEASAGYGSVGYFGWNSISKRMAMYYMTGDPSHARQVVRLAFPDERARAEIAEIDGERIENKDEPLSGPYHYNAHMMILFWDLIEESPVFSDAERLQITNAFARQLSHSEDQGWRRQIHQNALRGKSGAYAEPPPRVGSRHGQWSAIALYCLGRYFNTYYADPLWRHCMEAARWHFSSLHHHAWVDGESDNLFWYNTGMAPILTYLLLTGDRAPLENGILAQLLRGQDILVSGRAPDWALNSASIGFLHKAAHLTGDGRWLTYLYRTGIDLDVFRLGQSFWPGPELEPELPRGLVGRWSVQPAPEPMWRQRDSGLPLEHTFRFGSFRSAADAGGDFVLIKGMNEASRNAYHTFAVLQLRLDGHTLLEGYMNQLLVRADGLVEPRVAMDAVLRNCDVIGQTARATGEVPHAAFASWRRTLIQRIGRYALIVDALDFRRGSDAVEIEILWQGAGVGQALPDGGAIGGEDSESPFEIHLSEAVETAVRNGRGRMVWRGAVRHGERKHFFSLVAAHRDGFPPQCARLGARAAALALPQPALVAAGAYEGLDGDLLVLAQDHLHGEGLREANLGAFLCSTDRSAHLDWDFSSAVLEVVADESVRLRLALAAPSGLQLDGHAAALDADGALEIAAGRHVLAGAAPDPVALGAVRARLETLLSAARTRRGAVVEAPLSRPRTSPLETVFLAEVEAAVEELIVVPVGIEARICALAGSAVHLLTEAGAEVQMLRTDAPIRTLCGWAEHGLLLAGCVDEKVVAFDLLSGERRWVFTSEMDPAVWRAAKTYWFKSAPGHEGIHGLHTGVFLNGESQAFVGSACTLEILDASGALVHRLPIFWGPGARFALIDGPEASIDLLIARQPTDSHALAVVNNRTLDPTPRSFRDVPEGHANIGGWSCMSRKHIFYEDLVGDGEKEVISEINGTWNRVTVWARDGTPLHNAHFGPGESIPAQNVADLDLADLDGDGRKEIVALLASGSVVALDHRCDRVWTRRLAHPPAVLKCTGDKSWIGCADGTLVLLDGSGEIIRQEDVASRPTCIAALGDRVLVGTEAGTVKLLQEPSISH